MFQREVEFDTRNVLKFIMDLAEETNMKKVFIYLLFNSLLSNLAFAQNLQYPTLWKVHIYASITYDKNEQMFCYSYMLVNDAENTGSIDGFEIDISRKPTTVDIDTVGLRFENDGFTERSFRRSFPFSKGKIVPVGFLRTPGGTWTGGVTNNFTASFDGTRSYAVKPGRRSNGFEIVSKGSPSIRRCIVSPFFDFDSLFSEERFPNEEDIPNTDSIQNAVKFYGWTVGPTAPPANFDASACIDTLLSYARQSAELGWLAPPTGPGKRRDNDCDDDERPDDGITKNIEQRLQKAKRELMKGDSVQARKELEKLLQKVERIWKRSQKEVDRERRERWEKGDNVIMTSEAYALLKYKTEYLIDRLPEKAKHGRGDDEKDKKPKK
jgi:hypothetical protein